MVIHKKDRHKACPYGKILNMSNSPYHRRNHLRLPFYDYSQYGCYFVTICTKNRQSIFGDIIDGIMKLNEIGHMVQNNLEQLTVYYKNSIITDYIIMPNHLHFIWFNQDNVQLSEVIRKFKGNVTKHYHDLMIKQNKSYEPLWQRSFYEHIIRDDKDYERIATYIENNPLQWELDRFYNESMV